MASDDDDSGCSLDEFSWIPPGLTPSQVLQFMSCLPHNRIPYVGSVGDKYRVRQLVHQLPPQDIDASCCRTLSDEEKKELWLFSVRRRHEALGRGTVKELTSASDAVKCDQCKESMATDGVAVQASRAGDRAHWHPGCFVCSVCNELLVDLIYFYHEGRLFCGRHHAETLKPRCAACDEIIFGDECIEAEGRSWHMRHFVCAQCSRLLGGQRYVMRDASPYCCPCFEHLFADRCETCHQPISVDKGQLTSAGLHWHAADECFSCSDCRRSLLGVAFVPRNGQILCSDCSNRQTSSCGENEDSNISNSRSSSLQQQQQHQQQQQQQLLLQQSSDAILKKQTSCRRADVAQNIGAGAAEHCAPEKILLDATAVEKPRDETMKRRIGEIEKLRCFQPDSYMISSNKTSLGMSGKTNPPEEQNEAGSTLTSVLRNSTLSSEKGQTRPTRHVCSKVLRCGRDSATSLRCNSTNPSDRKNQSVHFDSSTENEPSTKKDLRSCFRHRLTSHASDTEHQQEKGEAQNVGLSTVLGPSPQPPHTQPPPAGDGKGTPMFNRVPRLGVRQLRHAVSAAAVPNDDSSEDPAMAPLTPRRVRRTGGRVRTDGYFSDIDRDSWTRQRRLDGSVYLAATAAAAEERWDRCSTCSSSSDSEFDYYLERPGGRTGGETVEWRGAALTTLQQQKERRQRFNSKHCLVS